MNRHEGVSCDSCLKSNFRGRRYKCLICYDYDLCANCYESGTAASRHTPDHPMQCVLTRSDFDLYYGGESLGVDQPQAYTCPFCNKMGFTDVTLQEHVTAEHAETSQEVVCPLCAAVPGGDPNLVTDDFAEHLTREHRTGHRDLISFLDEPTSIRHGGVRRIPHSGRGVATRARRSNMHFSTSGGLSALSPSSRDAVVDPIAELLSQLSGTRRVTGSSSQQTAPTQLQQIQMQLQLERQQVTARQQQQLDRLPRRQAALTTAPPAPATVAPPTVPSTSNQSAVDSNPSNSQFLLTRFFSNPVSEDDFPTFEKERRERSAFIQAAVLGSLSEPTPAPPPPPVRPQAPPQVARSTSTRTRALPCKPKPPYKEMKAAPSPPRTATAHLPESR